MKTLLPFIFYGLPESFLLISAALCLLGLKIRVSRLLIAGFCLGGVSYLAVVFLRDMGLHTAVILVALVLVLAIWFRLSIATSVTGCFLSYFLLSIGEILILSPIQHFIGFSNDQIASSPWARICLGWISAGFLIIAIAAHFLWRFKLLKAPEAE